MPKLCDNCGCVVDEQPHDKFCANAQDSVVRVMPRERSNWLVAVYDQAMRYGGPEEGGWWYDAGSLVRIVKVFANEDKALAYCCRLNTRLRSRAFGPNQGKRSYSSVLSDGELIAHVYENTAPTGFPEQRPHYE